MRVKLELFLAMFIALSVIIGISAAIGILVELVGPGELEVGGIIYPVATERWYFFKGRMRPQDPIVEVRVKISADWTRVSLVISNYLDRDVKGPVNIRFYDLKEEIVSWASIHAYVASKGSVEEVLGLTWEEGYRPADILWGKLEAEFRLEPKLI